MGRGRTAGPSKEEARGTRPLALRGKPPASRVITAQPSPASHSPRHSPRPGTAPRPAPVPAAGTAGAGKTRADPSRSLFDATAPERIQVPGAKSVEAPDTEPKPFRRPAPLPCRTPRAPPNPVRPSPLRPAPRLTAKLFVFCAVHWASAPPISTMSTNHALEKVKREGKGASTLAPLARA